MSDLTLNEIISGFAAYATKGDGMDAYDAIQADCIAALEAHDDAIRAEAVEKCVAWVMEQPTKLMLAFNEKDAKYVRAVIAHGVRTGTYATPATPFAAANRGERV